MRSLTWLSDGTESFVNKRNTRAVLAVISSNCWSLSSVHSYSYKRWTAVIKFWSSGTALQKSVLVLPNKDMGGHMHLSKINISDKGDSVLNNGSGYRRPTGGWYRLSSNLTNAPGRRVAVFYNTKAGSVHNGTRSTVDIFISVCGTRNLPSLSQSDLPYRLYPLPTTLLSQLWPFSRINLVLVKPLPI